MSQDFKFCDARAREAAIEAERTTLANVRDRALRSEKTWRQLAEKAKKVESDRAKSVAERKERQALESAQSEQREEAFSYQPNRP